MPRASAPELERADKEHDPTVGAGPSWPNSATPTIWKEGEWWLMLYEGGPPGDIALARSRLTRGLTDEECQQYLHVDTCPE